MIDSGSQMKQGSTKFVIGGNPDASPPAATSCSWRLMRSGSAPCT